MQLVLQVGTKNNINPFQYWREDIFESKDFSFSSFEKGQFEAALLSAIDNARSELEAK